MNTVKKELNISSAFLNREVKCTLLSSENAEPQSLLLLNDGQDVDSLDVQSCLQSLYTRNSIDAVLLVAIHAGDERVQEYGVAGNPDFKQRGAKAGAYSQFVIQELLPLIYKETGMSVFKTTAFAGFSLGGLSALDIAWHNSNVFNKAGVFSGALWWRSKDIGEGYTDNDRIMHRIVRETADKPELKFWLQTGTKDETADRNKNGIIDSIDDTIDLIKELETKGYARPADIHYVEVVGGEHNTATWGRVMSKFLCWAFSG